jgi:hypothetical protein
MKLINKYLYEKSEPIKPSDNKKFIFTPAVMIGTAIKRLIDGDETIGVDMEQFEHKIKNILLVVGIPSYGTRTPGQYLAHRYNCEYLDLNTLWEEVIDFDVKELNPDMIQKICKKIVIFALEKAKDKRVVIEGIQLFLGPPPFVNGVLGQFPCVFTGTPLLRRGMRWIKKTLKKNEDISHTEQILDKTIKYILFRGLAASKLIRKFRTERASMSGSTVREVTII